MLLRAVQAIREIMKLIGDTADRVLLHPFMLKMGYGLEHLFSYWPIVFRASLYFLIAALPSLVKAAQEFGTGSREPNHWILTSVIGEGIYQGCVGLRAYFDGSSSRLMAERKEATGNTAFFTKPTR